MASANQIYENNFTYASLSFATSGAGNVLIAAPSNTNQLLQIYKLVLVASGTVTVQLFDKTTALTGAMDLILGTPLILHFDGEPWFQLAAGDAFNATLGGATAVNGMVAYRTVFPSNQNSWTGTPIAV